MSYPDNVTNLREWCDFILNLIHKKLDKNGELCICMVHKLLKDFTLEEQKRIVSGLMWSVIIDQEFYYILVDKGFEFEIDNVRFDLENKEFYEFFSKNYNSPKLKDHYFGNHISPYFIRNETHINKNYPDAIPDDNCLLKEKIFYWGEISDWLCSMELDTLKDCFIAAFKEDEHYFLFDEYDVQVTARKIGKNERRVRDWSFSDCSLKNKIFEPWYKMMEDLIMHQTIRKWIEDILRDNMDLVWIAVRQRAKFEGWLKFELARYIMNKVDECVRVEKYFPDKRKHIDIAFKISNIQYYLELKTPNTNYEIENIEEAQCTITDNINSIINDARELRGIINNFNDESKGFCAFVMFPIPLEINRERYWMQHINRIGNELGIDLSENQHWIRLEIPYDYNHICDVIVCCFPV